MPSGEGRSGRTIPGAIKALFKVAAKAVALRGNDEPPPAARKRRGGTDSRSPLCVTPWLAPHGGNPAARGRYAVLPTGKTGAGKIARRFTRAAHDNTTQAAHDDAGLYLANGLELVQFWQDNAQYDCLDDIFNVQQDRYFPQP